MITLIRQELYKFFHQKTFVISGFVVIAYIAVMGMVFQTLNQEEPIISYLNSFGGSGWIIQIIISVVAANIFVNEFSNGSIKILLSRQYNRGAVFASKIFTIFIVQLLLFVIAYLTTVAVKISLLNKYEFNFNQLQNYFGELLASWMLILFIVMLSIILEKTAISVAMGIALYIGMFSQLINSYMFSLIDRIEIVKYNPVNMLNAGPELYMQILEKATHLGQMEIIIGNIFYVIVLFVVTLMIFRKKRI